MDVNGWKEAVDVMGYVFQPIVNIHTGVCIGHEALLRNFKNAGFATIQEVFDIAYKEQILFKLDLLLREKAVEKFSTIENYQKIKLFFNLDNRVLLMPDYSPGNTSEILKRYNLYPDMICFEISERHEFNCFPDARTILNMYKRQTYKIALDDFGTGYSGLQLLYHSEPDFIKIDRFFIAGIETDSKKKLFVAKVLNLAHILGIIVIAEGVETEEEFYFCKEIGCDYLQGYFVQKPTTDIRELKNKYEKIVLLNNHERRDKTLDRLLLHDRMEYLKPLHLYNREKNYFTDMSYVFETFRQHKNNTFFPVINGHQEPIGLIRERELKEYVYSKYGKDLLLNKAFGKTLMDFIVRCPVSDINTKIEKILEYFAMDENSEGILLTENGKYIGFLSARSLLRVINEKNITLARDQNPLTKLSGNTMINEFIEAALEDISSNYVISYFDFNNFKPFNDRYGFRQGDRAILLFADILKKASSMSKFFIGHVGGDDFFAGFKVGEKEISQIHGKIKYIIDKFRDDALSLHDQQDRANGYILSTDREGNEKRFPLLTVSAAILNIPAEERNMSLEEIGVLLAHLKKMAKYSTNKIALLPIHGTKSPCTKFVSNCNGIEL
jgi:EAL domain-containing protein (putative c-di-GMP-specific phosphodiesterase class I)/GGDEF domain-containing protein